MSITEVFHGLLILGDLIGPPTAASVQQWPMFLAGGFDEKIKAGLFYQHHGRMHTGSELDADPEVLRQLDCAKEIVRIKIDEIFDEAAKQDREQVLQELQSHNQPHELGTVAEIAAKFGISKSEVRRRKANNTLHELV